VHLRHVLATGVHPAIAPEALGEVGVTLAEVRAAWRASIAQTWPAESADGWDEILREPGPDEAATTAPPSARVHADRWTVEDRLDYALYAKAIAEFIRHPDAKPPMSSASKGRGARARPASCGWSSETSIPATPISRTLTVVWRRATLRHRAS
jgi:hypothetical protein